MASNWQQTYEELKKRKKKVDNAKNTTEIRQINRNYNIGNVTNNILGTSTKTNFSVPSLLTNLNTRVEEKANKIKVPTPVEALAKAKEDKKSKSVFSQTTDDDEDTYNKFLTTARSEYSGISKEQAQAERERINKLLKEQKEKGDYFKNNREWWDKDDGLLRNLGNVIYKSVLEKDSKDYTDEYNELLARYDALDEAIKNENVKNKKFDDGFMGFIDKSNTVITGNVMTGTRGIETTIKKILGEDITKDEVAPTYIEKLSNKALEESSGIEKVALDVQGSLGRMFPQMIVPAGKVATATGFANYGGGAYNQALQEGYTDEQATKYGVIIGTLEMALTKLLGTFGNVYGSSKIGNASQKIVDKVIPNIIKNEGVRYVLGQAISEGGEEFIQTYAEGIARDVLLDEKGFLKSTWENITDPDKFSEALYSAMIGGITGGTMSMGGNNANVEVAVDNTEDRVKGNSSIKEKEEVNTQTGTQENTQTNTQVGTQTQVTEQDLENIDNQLLELETQLMKTTDEVQYEKIAEQIRALEEQGNAIEQLLQQKEQGLPVYKVANTQQDTDIAPVQVANVEQTKQPTTQETQTNLTTEADSNTPKAVKSQNVEQIAPKTKVNVANDTPNVAIEERQVVNNELTEDLQDESVMTEDIIPETKAEKLISKEWTDKVNEQDKVNRPLAIAQAQATGRNTMVGYSPILSNSKLYHKGSLSWVTPDGKLTSKVVDETEIDSFLSKNKIDKLNGGINTFENGLENEIAPVEKAPSKETFTKEQIVQRNKRLQKGFNEIANENHPPLSDEFIEELNKQSIEWARESGKLIEEIAPVKEELADLKDEIKDTIKDTKKELKTLTKELKEVKKSVSEVSEEFKALTEEDLPALEQQAKESLNAITDDMIPLRNNLTMEETTELDVLENLPFDTTIEEQERMRELQNEENLIEEENTNIEVESPLKDRNIEDVGSRKVKAYQYEHPEVRPYFQDAAVDMLYDLNNSTKGERIIIGDISQTGDGNFEYLGIKRNTTPDIADLLDNYHYTYAEIEKGLKAIIEDNGKENIAVSKRIEFALDDRLRNGYTTVDGMQIPPNQDYINLLRDQEYSNYYDNIPIDENAPMENASNTEVNDYQEFRNEINAALEKAKKISEQFYNGLKSQQEEVEERHELEYFILKETNSRPTKNINDNFFKEHISGYDENRGIKTADGRLTVMKLQRGDNLAKLSFTEGEDIIWIDELYVKNQRQGYGSEIVNTVKKYAEENGKYVKAFKELSTAKGFWDKALRNDTKISEEIAPINNQSLAIEPMEEFDNGGPMIKVSPEMEIKPKEVELSEEPAEENKNMSIKESNELKLKNYEALLNNYNKNKQESYNSFNLDINKKIKEYNSLKNKNTKRANNLLQQIEILRKRRDNVQIEYEGKINRTEQTIGKMNSIEFKQRETRIDMKQKLLAKTGILNESLDNANKLPKILMENTDPIRLQEMIFGRGLGTDINNMFFQKVKDNTSEKTRFLNKERAELKDLGIKARSKESAAVQKYGEKQWVNETTGETFPYEDKDLANEFPDIEIQNKIKNAAKVIRQKYDNYLNRTNEVLTKLGYDPIPKRQDYMRHFQELNDIFSRVGIPYNYNEMTANDLPTDINGLTADFSPSKNFFASALRRTGNKTTYDAITGIDGYLEGVGNLIYHTEDIQRLRAFEQHIRDTYGENHGFDNLENLTNEEKVERIENIQDNHLSNYASWLHEYTNTLAGKKALLDRSIESLVGRKIYSFLNTTKTQVGRNMIGFNISSALTGIIPGVQTLAKTNKLAATKGLADTVKNVFRNDGFAEKNDFLTSRFGSDRLSKTLWGRIGDAGFVFMRGVDHFMANFVVRSKYNELKAKGYTDTQAHREAGKYASRLMSDRSQGATPNIYNSQMLGLVTQFQNEVNNQLYSMFYDTYHESREKAQGNALKTATGMTFTLGQLAVFTHLFGAGFEKMTGYNPTFDIIGMLMKAFGLDDDEDEDDTTVENISQAFDQLVDGLPYVNILTGGGRVPVSEAFTGVTDTFKALTGGKDEYGQNVEWEDAWGSIKESAPYFLLPTGYGQLKKTTKGLEMYDEDLPIAGSYTDSGNLRFTAEEDTWSKVQAGIFGQWANEEAQEYVDSDFKTINKDNIDELIDLGMTSSEYRDYRTGLSGKKSNEEKIEYINSLDVTDEQKNIMANNILDRDYDVDMSNYDEYSSYDEFDFYYKNQEKYDWLQSNGISYSEYAYNDESKELYNYAYKYPETYKVGTAITGDFKTYKEYADYIWDLKADKDENGDSISGTKKAKVIDYVRNLDLSIPQKAMLIRKTYSSFDDYNVEIVDYVSGLDLSYEDKKTILEELDMTLEDDGTVRWD